MANGWAPDGAVQDQIDDTIMDAVISARARIPAGESKINCLECDNEIPEPRRRALPGVQTCIACQSTLDRRAVALSAYNRKGNKDSQLK